MCYETPLLSSPASSRRPRQVRSPARFLFVDGASTPVACSSSAPSMRPLPSVYFVCRDDSASAPAGGSWMAQLGAFGKEAPLLFVARSRARRGRSRFQIGPRSTVVESGLAGFGLLGRSFTDQDKSTSNGRRSEAKGVTRPWLPSL